MLCQEQRMKPGMGVGAFVTSQPLRNGLLGQLQMQARSKNLVFSRGQTARKGFFHGLLACVNRENVKRPNYPLSGGIRGLKYRIGWRRFA